jgi:hypothetical protein
MRPNSEVKVVGKTKTRQLGLGRSGKGGVLDTGAKVPTVPRLKSIFIYMSYLHQKTFKDLYQQNS